MHIRVNTRDTHGLYSNVTNDLLSQQKKVRVLFKRNFQFLYIYLLVDNDTNKIL